MTEASTSVGKTSEVSSSESPTPFSFGAADRERAAAVLRQGFTAAQLGMPSEDPETAVESLWVILEALLVDHMAPNEQTERSRADRRTDVGNHWRRLVITAVTNTFVLSGDFVQPEVLADAVDDTAQRLLSGELWHTRRPPAQGALVLAVHTALQCLDACARSGRFPGPTEKAALEDLVACATLGAVMAGEILPSQDRDATATATDTETGPRGRWTRSAETVAASFGIPSVELTEVERSGWACTDCGCLFLGRVEAGVAYPDRFAPVGRSGPCDSGTDCACHAAPLQRRVR